MAEYNCNPIVEWKQADHWNVLASLDSFRFSETLSKRKTPSAPPDLLLCIHTYIYTYTERHLCVCLRQTHLSLLKFLITSSYLERLSHLGWFKIKIMQFKVPALTGWRECTCLFFRNACSHRLMSAILILYLPFCCYLFFILFVQYRVSLCIQHHSLLFVCEMEPFTDFGAHLIHQDYLVSRLQGASCLYLPNAEIKLAQCHIWLFNMGSGHQN